MRFPRSNPILRSLCYFPYSIRNKSILLRLLIILFIWVALLFNITKGQSKFSVGTIVAPSIERQLWLGTVEWLDYQDKPQINFGIGCSYSYKQFSLLSGLMVYDKGSYIRAKWANSSFPNDPVVKITFHNWYLSIPLTLDYNIKLKDRSSINPTIGVVYGRILWKYSMWKYYDKTEYHSRSYTRTNDNFFGLILGVGFKYRLNENSVIILRPNYIRQLNKGWDLNEEKNNLGRYDSYVFDLILLYDWNHLFNKKKAEHPLSE